MTQQQPWRVLANRLNLPYQDLGIQGNPGRKLHLPGDVGVVLAYDIIDSPNGQFTRKGDIHGVAFTGNTGVDWPISYTTTQIIGASATLVLPLPIRAHTVNIFVDTGPSLKITCTSFLTGAPFTFITSGIGTNTQQIVTELITLLNKNAVAGSFTLTAWGIGIG